MRHERWNGETLVHAGLAAEAEIAAVEAATVDTKNRLHGSRRSRSTVAVEKSGEAPGVYDATSNASILPKACANSSN